MTRYQTDWVAQSDGTSRPGLTHRRYPFTSRNTFVLFASVGFNAHTSLQLHIYINFRNLYCVRFCGARAQDRHRSGVSQTIRATQSIAQHRLTRLAVPAVLAITARAGLSVCYSVCGGI